MAQDWEKEYSAEPYPHDVPDAWVKTNIICGHQWWVKEYSPSTTPAQWAALQLELKIRTSPMYQDGDFMYWVAATHEILWDAKTLGLAICKAFIAAKFGDEIPDEIWEKVK